ncbi:MAG: J domain-containing protein [Candidatus Limnocylindria bacterium]
MTMRLLPYTPERDAYRLLGVAPSASIDEIGTACRRLARTFHPDHNQSPRATQEMQVVNAVRRVLSDPEWRATYDRERWRFHAERLSARAPVAPPIDLMPPPRLENGPPSQVTRYARALAIGVRAAFQAMLPARCVRCRIVIGRMDVYCAACGTPLLTTGRRV